jgi:thioredoxin 1
VPAVTDANFESQVLASDQVVLVDFWAEWCAPCRMIAPVVDELATAPELEGRVKFMKMDIDHNPEAPQRLGIMSIPTLIMFKGGKAADRVVGYRGNIKSELQQKLSALL